ATQPIFSRCQFELSSVEPCRERSHRGGRLLSGRRHLRSGDGLVGSSIWTYEPTAVVLRGGCRNLCCCCVLQHMDRNHVLEFVTEGIQVALSLVDWFRY